MTHYRFSGEDANLGADSGERLDPPWFSSLGSFGSFGSLVSFVILGRMFLTGFSQTEYCDPRKECMVGRNDPPSRQEKPNEEGGEIARITKRSQQVLCLQQKFSAKATEKPKKGAISYLRGLFREEVAAFLRRYADRPFCLTGSGAF